MKALVWTVVLALVLVLALGFLAVAFSDEGYMWKCKVMWQDTYELPHALLGKNVREDVRLTVCYNDRLARVQLEKRVYYVFDDGGKLAEVDLVRWTDVRLNDGAAAAVFVPRDSSVKPEWADGAVPEQPTMEYSE